MAEHDAHAQTPHEPEGPAAARGRTALRRLLALASLIPLGAAVGALALTPPADPVDVQQAQAESRPGASTRFCHGALQLPEELLGAGTDSELSVTPPSPVVSLRTVSAEPASSLLFGTVSGSATLQEEDGSVRAPSITTRSADGTMLGDDAASQDMGVALQGLGGIEGAPQVTSATSQGERPVADTLQATATTSGDYRSLTMTRCTEPVTEASFLGVSTDTGDSSVLVLRNPTERPATASVQLWTEDGPAAMEGRSQVVVAPGTEERVLLESVAAGQAAVGVDVSVLGSPLSMHVQTTEREGLTPGGAEILEPLPAPATEQVMPGVDVAGTAPTLVLANPRGDDTTAAVEVIGPDGPIEAASLDSVEVPAGTVLRTPLDGLPDGTYAVTVRSSEPLTAVTRSERTGEDLPGDTVGAPIDFTLVAPAPALRSHGLSAVPAGGRGELTLAGTADSAVTVIPIAADGSAGEALAVEVGADATTTLTASQLTVGDAPAVGIAAVPEVPGAVHAAWTHRVGDGAGGLLLSTLAVPSGEGGGSPVTVRLDG